jgi:hypothetical protein
MNVFTPEGLQTAMGEWKSQVSFRIQPTLRIELQEFADQERRSLGNLGAVLLEWGFEQLKAVGSVDRLLKGRIRGEHDSFPACGE